MAKLKDLENRDITKLLVRIPEGVEQLGEPLEEVYIVSIHAHGTGLFISQDPPESKKRRLIPVYPEKLSDILEWETVDNLSFES